jgi:hypothetical protein
VNPEECAEAIRQLRAVLRRVVYGVALLALAAVVIGIGNIAYTNRVDERRARSAAQVEIARSAVAEQNRLLVCSLAIAQAEALNGAGSEAGRRSHDAWVALATRFNCS